MKALRPNRGFTIIELVAVVLIICVLAALIALTASGVQAKNRNGDRETRMDTLRSQLETYYARTNTYPTLSNVNDAAWRTKNLPHLKDTSLRDPRWSNTVAACTAKTHPILAAQPAANCFSYQVASTEGSACDNVAVSCAHYTLTARLEGGEQYTKSSLNN